MLIAEDLLLLLTDNTSGRFLIDGAALDLALAGAIVLELAERGRISVAGEGDRVKTGRLMVRSPMPTGDSTLDDALSRCADRAGKRPENVVGPVAKGLRRQLLDRLEHAGILRAQRGRVLGVMPTTRWPAIDLAHESQVLARLRGVLVLGTTPDVRTASLISLLSAVDASHKVLAAAGEAVDKKAVRARAKEIRDGGWAADAVAKAIQVVQSAVAAGVTASMVAASVAGSSS